VPAGRPFLGALIVILTVSAPAASLAQGGGDSAADSSESTRESATDAVKFLGGAALAFTIHEGGHLLLDAIFDAHPEVQPVHFGPLPFFAITPTGSLESRQLYAVSAAGFWTQALTSEMILARHPDLRHEQAPFQKGVLAFDVLTSVGYAMVAFAETGPAERDTLSMARGLGVNERAIGALILAPALLNAYRYYRPDAKWARWTARALEAGSVVLVVK
jgi:hypothetical protein